nr:hypothetical protein [Actinomadura physcomitrii]
MVDQHLDHGRHEHRVGHRVPLDRLHHRDRFERRDEDVPAAVQDLGVPGHQVGEVEHRRRVQVGPARLEGQSAGGDPVRRREEVGVRQHHALREARGPTGVEQSGEFVSAPPRVLDRIVGGDDLLVGHGALREGAVARVDDGG